MNKNVVITHGITGDVKVVLSKLNQMLEQQNHSEWIQDDRSIQGKISDDLSSGRVSGPFVVEEIYRQTKGDAVIVTEVGQNQMWAAQYYKYPKPRTLLTSGGLGTMGYGLGASIGAKCARPEKCVVNIAGDGCFHSRALRQQQHVIRFRLSKSF